MVTKIMVDLFHQMTPLLVKLHHQRNLVSRKRLHLKAQQSRLLGPQLVKKTSKQKTITLLDQLHSNA
jgi:hypothetical protein